MNKTQRTGKHDGQSRRCASGRTSVPRLGPEHDQAATRWVSVLKLQRNDALGQELKSDLELLFLSLRGVACGFVLADQIGSCLSRICVHLRRFSRHETPLATTLVQLSCRIFFLDRWRSRARSGLSFSRSRTNVICPLLQGSGHPPPPLVLPGEVSVLRRRLNGPFAQQIAGPRVVPVARDAAAGPPAGGSPAAVPSPLFPRASAVASARKCALWLFSCVLFRGLRIKK